MLVICGLSCLATVCVSKEIAVLQWEKTGSPNPDHKKSIITALAVDDEDNIIAVGTIKDISSKDLPDDSDWLLLKLDSRGTVVWKRVFDSLPKLAPADLEVIQNWGPEDWYPVSADSAAWVGVMAGGTIVVGGFASPVRGEEMGYLVKTYAPNGTPQRTYTLGQLNALATSQNSLFLATEGGRPYSYVQRLDGSFKIIWSRSHPGETARILFPDDEQRVVLVGTRWNKYGNVDVFARKYDSTGDVLWEVAYDRGHAHDNPCSVAFDRRGRVLVEVGYSGIAPNKGLYRLLSIGPDGKLLEIGTRDWCTPMGVDTRGRIVEPAGDSYVSLYGQDGSRMEVMAREVPSSKFGTEVIAIDRSGDVLLGGAILKPKEDYWVEDRWAVRKIRVLSDDQPPQD